MFKQSLKAGFITGATSASLVFLIFLFSKQLGLVWPVAFVPVFCTGVYALHRCGSAVAGARSAFVAGAVAGLTAALPVLVAVVFVSAMTGADNTRPYPYWNLVPILQDHPVGIPQDILYFDLPAGQLPFAWPINRVTPEGVRLARIPWSLPLFPPVGLFLSGLQAWLFYLLVQQVNIGRRAVGRVERMSASFETKLLLGFIILTVAIFAVGWLGWASTEEMHIKVHAGSTAQHWLDHTVQLQANLQTQEEALARLTGASDEATLKEIASLGQKVTADLRHLKTTPAHRELGSVGQANLRSQRDESQPAVLETESRFGDFTKAITKMGELSKGGNATEAGVVLGTLGPLLQKVEVSLQELANNLNSRQVGWMSDMNDSSHGQQWATMLLVLLATGAAIPLGYVFSQVVIQPVGEVNKGLVRIGAGDFSSRVEVENQDELGELAQRVNQMSAELDGLYAELRDLNENLQQKVGEQLQEIERGRTLKRYLSPQLTDSILDGTVTVDLVSSRKNLTVFFSDIRGFTALSERMEPEELVDLLNEYLTLMTDIVFKHGGTLDKYIGDAIMVFFGDPVPYQDHAERAVLMAMEMKAQLAVFQNRWFIERDELLTVGMGVSTGYVTVGNIGSRARLDYTVIGNQVNLASRLADMAQPGQILVAERTLLAVRDLVDATQISEVTLEGVSRPVKVYEINEKAAGPLDSPTVAS